jgi:hypothetical protein
MKKKLEDTNGVKKEHTKEKKKKNPHTHKHQSKAHQCKKKNNIKTKQRLPSKYQNQRNDRIFFNIYIFAIETMQGVQWCHS